MKKTIIFDPSDQRILFLLVAAIKAGYSPNYPQRLQHLWEAEEIILLNIDPNEELVKLRAHPDFDTFISFKLANIKAFIHFPEKPEQKKFFDRDNPSVQNILKYFSPQMEIDSLDLIDKKRWAEKPVIARLGQALRAAKVLSVNRDDMTEYQELLINTAKKLANGKKTITIDTFQIQYQRIIDTTEYCFKKVSPEQKLIALPNKEISFGYLDNVSYYLDFSLLREKCLNSYPFLTIIQYRQREREYNWFLSRGQLNLQKVLQLPTSDNKHELLIEYSHSLMRLHLQKAVEGIIKK